MIAGFLEVRHPQMDVTEPNNCAHLNLIPFRSVVGVSLLTAIPAACRPAVIKPVAAFL